MEFLSDTCQTLSNTHEIIHYKTCPHTSQQNGVVKKKHQHLIQITRALLFQSGLPKCFWEEALLQHILLITYLQKFYPGKPHMRCYLENYQIINLWKSLDAFVLLPIQNPHKDKLASRDNPCAFLGFQSGFKAYKVYDIVQNKTIMTRDIIFHESKFPFLNSKFDYDPFKFF